MSGSKWRTVVKVKSSEFRSLGHILCGDRSFQRFALLRRLRLRSRFASSIGRIFSFVRWEQDEDENEVSTDDTEKRRDQDRDRKAYS